MEVNSFVKPIERTDWLTEGDIETIPSTEAKNVFGSLLDKALAGKTVVITRRDAPKAVLLGIEQYESLARAKASRLDSLGRAFDERLVAMQSAESRAATKAAFHASSKELARAAVKTARKRG